MSKAKQNKQHFPHNESKENCEEVVDTLRRYKMGVLLRFDIHLNYILKYIFDIYLNCFRLHSFVAWVANL